MIRVLPFLFLVPTALFARIGDTPEESTRRYGKARMLIAGDGGVIKKAEFRTKSFTIIEEYVDGQCEHTIIRKADLDKEGYPTIPSKMTQSDAMEILKINSRNEEWSPLVNLTPGNEPSKSALFAETKSKKIAAKVVDLFIIEIRSRKHEESTLKKSPEKYNALSEL